MHAQQSEKMRAKRLARWLNRLIQLNHQPIYGYVFTHGIAVPVTYPTHPTQHGDSLCLPN